MDVTLNYKFSDTEIKKMLQELIVIVDTREQQNKHILEYFDNKKIKYKVEKLNYGDYTCMLPENKEVGLIRNTYFTNSLVIERKGSLEELSGNLTKDRSRLEEEFTRAKGKIILLIEDATYDDIVNQNYKTNYKPSSFVGSLKAFEARYNLDTNFVTKSNAGNFIFQTLYYHAREFLKR